MNHCDHPTMPLVAPSRITQAQHKVQSGPRKHIDENLVQVKAPDLDHGCW